MDTNSMLPGVVHRRGEGGVGASEKRELSTGGGTEDQRNQRRLKHQRCRARACVPSKETKWKGWGGGWPLQDIVLLQSFIVGVRHPFISLPYWITIACTLHKIRPPTNPSCVCHAPYNIGYGNIV